MVTFVLISAVHSQAAALNSALFLGCRESDTDTASLGDLNTACGLTEAEFSESYIYIYIYMDMFSDIRLGNRKVLWAQTWLGITCKSGAMAG
jgi:hypothetical protein